MTSPEPTTDDVTTSLFDDDQMLAVAASIASSFGLGEELEATSTWRIDSGDCVLAVPFEGERNGTLLLAVNLDVSERLLFDRASLTAELQKAVDTLEGHGLQLGEVGESRERPPRSIEIKDGDDVCALVAFLDAASAGAASADKAPVAEAQAATTVRRAEGSWAISDDDLRLLDVLGDIDVVVSVELGRTTMPVSAVLGLLPGTVFELGRTMDGPVDLVVDDSVIGHGDVVTVDEHFAVRLSGAGA